MAKGATGVKAQLIADENHDQLQNTPGAFRYFKYGDEEDVGLLHSCPCGCGMFSSINLKPHGGKTRPMWTNDGTREVPNLNPSIGIHPWDVTSEYPERAKVTDGPYHWHGYLRNGVWESV